jgi:hypothetical protein
MRVGGGRFEDDDGFAWAHQVEAFPRQSFQRFGIVTQSIDGTLELARGFFLNSLLFLKLKQVFPHAFVGLDKGKVQDGHSENAGEQEENHHYASELVPDSDVDIHGVS